MISHTKYQHNKLLLSQVFNLGLPFPGLTGIFFDKKNLFNTVIQRFTRMSYHLGTLSMMDYSTGRSHE